MSDKPKRIQRKRAKGWKMPPNTVYVGRPTKWGNPHRVSRATCSPTSPSTTAELFLVANGISFYQFRAKAKAIEASILLFRKNVEHEANASYRAKVRFALRGKDLACWCPLDQPCHADVLLEIANAEDAHD